MAEIPDTMGHVGDLAQPLHIQRLNKSLQLQPFLNSIEKIFKHSQSDKSDDESSELLNSQPGLKLINGIPTTRDEQRSDKMRLYNFTNVKSERKWLRDVLISDSSDSSSEDEISEAHFQRMLQLHVEEKKLRLKFHTKPKLLQYQYYGTGFLSNYDKYPEHKKSVVGIKKLDGHQKSKKKSDKNLFSDGKHKKLRKNIKKESSFMDTGDRDEVDNDDSMLMMDDFDDEQDKKFTSLQSKGSRGRRRADKFKSPEVMALRRRKLWGVMAKKELAKGQRAKAIQHKEVITTCKKVAQLCIKHWKQRALQSQKNMKETVWRNKRLTREMQAYWKRYERVERDTRRRQEKEAEEQRKMDVELMEVKRQQRKLNFLITQTELYAHFISKKISPTSTSEQTRILSQLDEEMNPRLAALDSYDIDEVKLKATKNVKEAISAERARTIQFDHSVCKKEEFNLSEANIVKSDERPQPAMFQGKLKHYQLKGMNWLSNLYDQGINGILADEMGLGKTVQSIAFLCHIAEKYSVWGPFLIISPASTLHNWQQEMQRFVPDFKVVPYWGSVQERKILRQFWEQKDLHTRDASFHVVITSYQLVITDFKYFNRVKWQYLILDEAQAIKSSNSMRWKLLLGFSCRNRLLLSGTPIQNSMAELWALLHFIMPTLFDNHDEFSEWFSKDIESQAENKSKIDEKHLSRLHMILKPFMLRRIKKDVENELSDKIEIMVYCPLTIRQKLLYSGLKQKIRIEDLLAGISGRGGTGTGSTNDDVNSKNVASSLMNLVMQFRKVCNHPELFERREARSPFFIQCLDYVLPKLLFDDGLLSRSLPSLKHIVYGMLNINTAYWMHHSVYSSNNTPDNLFSFIKFVGLSYKEFVDMMMFGILYIWLQLSKTHRDMEQLHYRRLFWPDTRVRDERSRRDLLIVDVTSHTSYPSIKSSSIMSDLVFTSHVGDRSTVYTHTRHVHHSMPETLQHRVLRSEKLRCKPESQVITGDTDRGKSYNSKPTVSNGDDDVNSYLVPEFPYVERPPTVFECVPTNVPEFLYAPSLKIQCRSRRQYFSSRDAAWYSRTHEMCSCVDGLETVWYGSPDLASMVRSSNNYFYPEQPGGLLAAKPRFGWSNIVIPDKQTMVADAGKLYVLDGLLKRLKEEGHRVLIYSQMTRMIDLLEEYMWHRKHTYMRLDGSSKISERRDMVADFQSRADIFVFLLSTRAGGLGINLTAADTVIFYDSDWNPTVDQQAMDRAHRLGQTKQVTVYRLICKGTIEERILQRAREKSEIQRMVISGGNFKPDHLKPKEVVSLLLDDDEIEKKYQQKQAEKKIYEFEGQKLDKKRKPKTEIVNLDVKRVKVEPDDSGLSVDSVPPSPSRSDSAASCPVGQDDTSNDGLIVDIDTPPSQTSSGSNLTNNPYNQLGIGSLRVKPVSRGSRRGRPRGLRRGACNSGRKRYNDDIKLPGEMFLSGESPSTSTTSDAKKNRSGGAAAVAAGAGAPPVRRGPGRPRMKPYIPGNRGSRGGGRGRKAPAPLQVPLMRTSASSSPARSSGAETPRPYGFYTPGSSGTD